MLFKVTQDLYAIQVLPTNDIILQARSNAQSTETEILLYDIYVCLKKSFLFFLVCLFRRRVKIIWVNIDEY